jgi:hypothetical protein
LYHPKKSLNRERLHIAKKNCPNQVYGSDGSRDSQTGGWASQGQLSLSQGMMKNGDDVAVDDDDDDAARTSVSQNRMTATLCTEELFLRTLYIQ